MILFVTGIPGAATALDTTSLSLPISTTIFPGRSVIVYVGAKFPAENHTVTITDTRGHTWVIPGLDNWSTSGLSSFIAMTTITNTLLPGDSITITADTTTPLAAQGDVFLGLHTNDVQQAGYSDRVVASSFTVGPPSSPLTGTPFLDIAMVTALSTSVTLADGTTGYTSVPTVIKTTGGTGISIFPRYKLISSFTNPGYSSYSGTLSSSVSAMWAFYQFPTSGSVFLRPISDITVGDSVPVPSSAANLYSVLDETNPDDADYIQGTQAIEVKVG